MQALERVFQFEGSSIRVEVVDGEPLFRAADVTPHLGLDDTRQAVERLADDEKIKRVNQVVSGTGDSPLFPPPRTEWWVTESGLYALVLGSRKPEASRFRRWVTHEVLPSIRKTGSYGAPALDLRDPAQLAPIALQLARLVEDQQRQLAEAKPAVEFVDRFVDATGRYTLQNAGRVLGVGANRFPKWLLDRHYLHRQDGRLVPYAQYLEAGLFEVKVVKVQAGRGEAEHAYQQTYVTAKGLKRFAGELAQEALVLP